MPTKWEYVSHGAAGSLEHENYRMYETVMSHLKTSYCDVILNQIKKDDDSNFYLFIAQGRENCSLQISQKVIEYNTYGDVNGNKIIEYPFGMKNFNYYFLSDIKKTGKFEYELATREWAEGDYNASGPSIKLKYKFYRENRDSPWKSKEIFRKSYKDMNEEEIEESDSNWGYIPNFQEDKSTELVVFNKKYENYEAFSIMKKYADLFGLEIAEILKAKGTPYLFITTNGLHEKDNYKTYYKIMSFDPDAYIAWMKASSDERKELPFYINTDYFNYKYNSLEGLQSFEIISPDVFKFTIDDKDNEGQTVTYQITKAENDKWKTSEISRQKKEEIE